MAPYLPNEMWVKIFKIIDYFGTFGRAQYANRLRNLEGRPQEERVVRNLPVLEKNAWRESRAFYAIDQQTRAIAINMKLSSMVMATCSHPLAGVTELCGLGVKYDERMNIRTDEHTHARMEHLAFSAIHVVHCSMWSRKDEVAFCTPDVWLHIQTVYIIIKEGGTEEQLKDAVDAALTLESDIKSAVHNMGGDQPAIVYTC